MSASTRRSFFGLAGGAALLCTLGTKEAVKLDASASRVRRPRGAVAQDVPQIQPAPGGQRREYWIQAETVKWQITPLRKDEWLAARQERPWWRFW